MTEENGTNIMAAGLLDEMAVSDVVGLLKTAQDFIWQVIQKNSKKAQDLDVTDIRQIIKDWKQTQEDAIAEKQMQEDAAAVEQAQEDALHMIRKRIDALAFMTDYYKSPLDTLSIYNLPDAAGLIDRVGDKMLETAVRKIGADPEKIKESRQMTAAQGKLILYSLVIERLMLLDNFFNSNYMQATEILESVKGKYTDPEPADDYTIKQYAVLYFFANHPAIKPHAAGELTEKNMAEIAGNFNRLDAFYYKKASGGKAERTRDWFIDFVKQDSPIPAQILKLLPRIMASPPGKLDYPVDKINNNVWHDLAAMPECENGQIWFSTEKKGSRSSASVLYSINFDGLEKEDGLKLTKKLTAFDKRVYIAVSAIFAQGVKYMSAGQIFTAMGGRGKPSKLQLQRIHDSLTKMKAAQICIDNSLETPVNKKYPSFQYDASLLPFERVRGAYINNALVESVIHLFREPPLMTFARERRQITTVTRKLLEIPLNHTEDNLILIDYLIENVARMKNNSRQSRKLLFSTIYEKCGINGTSGKDRTARSRTPGKIRTCLDHFKAQGYIKGYTVTKNSVIIDL